MSKVLGRFTKIGILFFKICQINKIYIHEQILFKKHDFKIKVIF